MWPAPSLFPKPKLIYSSHHWECDELLKYIWLFHRRLIIRKFRFPNDEYSDGRRTFKSTRARSLILWYAVLRLKGGGGRMIDLVVRELNLEILIIIVRQSCLLGFLHFVLQLLLPLGIHLNFGRRESRHGDELQVGITDQLSCQP